MAEVAALLPPLVQLEFEGRYAAMLSHEPKNYALLGYDGTLLLRGVAFRSSRAEPFGEAFLRRAIAPAARRRRRRRARGRTSATAGCARRRELADARRVVARATDQDAGRVPRDPRTADGKLPYEAMLASGRTAWSVGDRVRVYRTTGGFGVVMERDGEDETTRTARDRRDYDVDYYLHVLRDTFAARLARAFAPEDYAAVFADPDQLSLFDDSLATTRTVLTPFEALPRA